MNWNNNKTRWNRVIKDFLTKFESDPTSVRVYGVEGETELPVDVR